VEVVTSFAISGAPTTYMPCTWQRAPRKKQEGKLTATALPNEMLQNMPLEWIAHEQSKTSERKKRAKACVQRVGFRASTGR